MTEDTEKLFYYGDSIKAVGNTVKGYLIRFGSPNDHDLEGDYFTASTDFGRPILDGQKFALNLYYNHGQDKVIGTKSIGTGFVKMDNVGLWYEAQIEMNDEYNKMIFELAKQGKLGFSSGSAAHLVERTSKGASYEIKRWTLAEASLTPRPAESRNIASVKNLKAKPEDLSVGDYVQWMAYGTDVRGQIIDIAYSGTLVGQPLGTEMEGSEENPVFKIRVYQKQPDGSYEMDDATTVHRAEALSKIQKPYKTEDEMPEPINPENVFGGIESEMLLDSIECLNERMLEAMRFYVENPSSINLDDLFMKYAEVGMATIEQFMSKGYDVEKEMENYYKKLPHKPIDIRDAEKTLREAMSLSRSEAKKLASVVWQSLRDVNNAEEQKIENKVEEEVKSAEIDNKNSNLRQMLLKKAMLDLLKD